MAKYVEQSDDYWIVEDDAGYGNALVLRRTWSKRYLKLVTKYRIKIVRLNQYIGWHDSNLSFLLEIPGIHGIDILSDKVTDVSTIFELKKLKTLSLFCPATVA